jgi:hypothetical protein
MERVHGLFLLRAILENKFDNVVDFPGITHHSVRSDHKK